MGEHTPVIGSSSTRLLVVGADRGIGSALFKAILLQGGSVVPTTRRRGSAGLFLDLSDVPDDFLGDTDIACAFLCAARSGFGECEEDPEGTYRVNVEGVVAVARRLLENGSFVVFLSTSAVFDGSSPWPDESSQRCPTTGYGRQKAVAEDRLLEMDRGRGRVAVVRLTKVLTGETPIIKKFADQLLGGSPVDAFSDVKFSPLSMPHVVQSLVILGSSEDGGVYHLSGEDELSYAEFARRMARKMTADPGMVRGTVSSGDRVYFRPEFPGLGMANTRRRAGIQPEPGDTMLQHLLSGIAPVDRHGE